MHIHNTNMASKTKKQWIKLGYIPKENAKGELLWINPYCPSSEVYYEPEEVRKLSEEEHQQILRTEREERNKAAREERAYQRKLREERLEIFNKKIDSCNGRLALVKLENGDILHYIIPITKELNTTGIFPYGTIEYKGEVIEFVKNREINKLIKQSDWFPYKLKKMCEQTTS